MSEADAMRAAGFARPGLLVRLRQLLETADRQSRRRVVLYLSEADEADLLVQLDAALREPPAGGPAC